MSSREPGMAPPRRPRWSALALLLSAALGCGEDTTAVLPPCGSAPALVPGEVVTATLGPGSTRRGGAYIQHYTVWPDAAARVRIRMSSFALEPFLFLFDASGRVIDQAIASPAGGGAHTAILASTLAGECHTVGASAWSADSSGVYTLRLDPDGAP